MTLLSHFRGRTEAKACQNCEDINDSELNKEIFDLPWQQTGNDGDTEDEVPTEERLNVAEKAAEGPQEDEEMEGIVKDNRLGPIRENIPVGGQVRKHSGGAKSLKKCSKQIKK